MSIQTIGIREFRTHLHKYTRQNKEPIKITSHGEPIGYFIPVSKSPQEREFTALIEATKKLSTLLNEKGISVEEMVADFQEARQQDSGT
ncbi:MAG: type II toxin-antitoxin system Phd/YefM family antitoxin [Chloroflexi bacterium]|nr:type II toxin-antitoxin system Phd/YefM family antitoxin [Chloroflexota bacterium]